MGAKLRTIINRSSTTRLSPHPFGFPGLYRWSSRSGGLLRFSVSSVCGQILEQVYSSALPPTRQPRRVSHHLIFLKDSFLNNMSRDKLTGPLEQPNRVVKFKERGWNGVFHVVEKHRWRASYSDIVSELEIS